MKRIENNGQVYFNSAKASWISEKSCIHFRRFKLVIVRRSHRYITEYFLLKKSPRKTAVMVFLSSKNSFWSLLKIDLPFIFRGDLEIYKAFTKIIFDLHFSHQLFQKKSGWKLPGGYHVFSGKKKNKWNKCPQDSRNLQKGHKNVIDR